jgi:hypothetical protein
MATAPQIDRNAIVAAIAQRFPSADVSCKTINPEYDSWIIDVRNGNRLVSVSWGPLSGFGATDHQALREDGNPFGAYDWSLETADQAVEFVAERLLVSSANKSLPGTASLRKLSRWLCGWFSVLIASFSY